MKISLPLCGSSSPDGLFEPQMFYFVEVQCIIISFVVCAFGVMSKKLKKKAWLNPR